MEPDKNVYLENGQLRTREVVVSGNPVDGYWQTVIIREATGDPVDGVVAGDILSEERREYYDTE